MAEALTAATAAGQWTVVELLGRQLAERWRARSAANVADLDLERAKRKR